MIDAIDAALSANPNLDNAVLQNLALILSYLNDILKLLNNCSGRVERNTGKNGGGQIKISNISNMKAFKVETS